MCAQRQTPSAIDGFVEHPPMPPFSLQSIYGLTVPHASPKRQPKWPSQTIGHLFGNNRRTNRVDTQLRMLILRFCHSLPDSLPRPPVVDDDAAAAVGRLFELPDERALSTARTRPSACAYSTRCTGPTSGMSMN